MMKQIAVIAAALSFIVGASPAFAIFPYYPTANDQRQNASAEALGIFDKTAPTPIDEWTPDLGWEALSALPPAAANDGPEVPQFDGLSFSQDLLGDQDWVAGSTQDFAI